MHGGYVELVAQIKKMQRIGCFRDQSSLILNDNYYMVFTGDFADRGLFGLEVYQLVLTLKKANPNKVFLCRGNHEELGQAQEDGFILWTASKAQALQQNGICNISSFDRHFNDPMQKSDVVEAFRSLFDRLPVAIFLGIKDPATNRVSYGMFNHAGLPSDAPKLRAISTILQTAGTSGQSRNAFRL